MLLRGLLGLVLLLMMTCAAVFCAVCICAGKKRTARPSDCIIVPGAKVRPDGSMSNSLRWRCETALEAWKNGVAENIIVCGGQGADEPVAEAEAMRKWLMERGVPAEKIHADAVSTDTQGNFANAAGMMRQQGWITAAVATSDYHVQRSLWLARDAGIDACGIPAQSPKSPWGFFRARVRESGSWLLYGWRQIF